MAYVTYNVNHTTGEIRERKYRWSTEDDLIGVCPAGEDPIQFCLKLAHEELIRRHKEECR